MIPVLYFAVRLAHLDGGKLADITARRRVFNLGSAKLILPWFKLAKTAEVYIITKPQRHRYCSGHILRKEELRDGASAKSMQR